MLQQEGLATILAWNNYDKITEPLSSSESLHEKVCICYQNWCLEQCSDIEDPSHLLQVKKLWMMAFAIVYDMPMWKEWNSTVSKEILLKQVVDMRKVLICPQPGKM